MANRASGWLGVAALGVVGAAAAAAVHHRGKASLPSRQSGGYVTTRVVTVARSMKQACPPWADQEWLSVVLDRPVTVERLDDHRWRYVVGKPGDGPGQVVETTYGGPDGSIHWRVEEGPMVHEGRLELAVAPGDRGTELRVHLTYPEGRARHRIRALRGDDPDQVLRSVLRRAKSMIESGQVVSTMHEPSGRGPVAERTTNLVREKLATGGRP